MKIHGIHEVETDGLCLWPLHSVVFASIYRQVSSAKHSCQSCTGTKHWVQLVVDHGLCILSVSLVLDLGCKIRAGCLSLPACIV